MRVNMCVYAPFSALRLILRNSAHVPQAGLPGFIHPHHGRGRHAIFVQFEDLGNLLIRYHTPAIWQQRDPKVLTILQFV